MHPIERLRYVARATGADPATLVTETAIALRGLRGEPAGLVLACRRIIERHPTVGPLWWLCARLLSSSEPFELARQLAEDFTGDATATHLANVLSTDSTICVVGWSAAAMQAAAHRGDCRLLVVDSRGNGESAINVLERANMNAQYVPLESASAAVSASDVVIIEAMACGPNEVLCAGGSHGVASIAYCERKPVWLVAGLGTRLPELLWLAMKERGAQDRQAWDVGNDVVSTELFSKAVGPSGVTDAQPIVFTAECGPTPELLRRSAM